MGFVVACLLVVSTADRALAGCGDWLEAGGIEHDPARAHEPFGPPVPCRGPNCRRSQDLPPASPTAPSRVGDQHERWLELSVTTTPATRQCAALPLPVEPAPQGGFPLRIDRPPRVV